MSFVRLQQCYGIERELLEIKYATRNEASVVVSPKNRLKSNNCSISFLLVYGFTTLCCRHWNELGSRSVRAELFTKIRQKEILVSETINKGIDWLLCEFITFSEQRQLWRGHGNNEVWTSRLFVCERLWNCNRYAKRLDTFSLGKFLRMVSTFHQRLSGDYVTSGWFVGSGRYLNDGPFISHWSDADRLEYLLWTSYSFISFSIDNSTLEDLSCPCFKLSSKAAA